MIPAQAATQKIRLPATPRSKSGFAARRCCHTKATAAASATMARPSTSVPLPGTGAKLIESTRPATSMTERMPPRLSTGSVDSLTCAGTNAHAITSATTANGKVTRKTEPHQKLSSSQPATRGPSDAMAPPRADHRAIDLVRAGPVHRAVIRANVVG